MAGVFEQKIQYVPREPGLGSSGLPLCESQLLEQGKEEICQVRRGSKSLQKRHQTVKILNLAI